MEEGEYCSLHFVVFELGYLSFLALRLKLGPELVRLALLLFRPSDLDWNYTIGSPGSGHLGLHNCVI